jgi:hypothetical protein
MPKNTNAPPDYKFIQRLVTFDGGSWNSTGCHPCCASEDFFAPSKLISCACNWPDYAIFMISAA